MSGPPRRPPIERFMEKVDITENCWIWRGAHQEFGYGRFSLGGHQGRIVSAHRWAYEYFVGPIPPGMQIDHLCRNPPCVNPEHLEPVTNRENTIRGDRGHRPAACQRGHLWTPDNTHICANGRRRCITCIRIASLSRPKKPRRPRHVRPLAERFWEKVDKRGPNECWLWTAAVNRDGYGRIGLGRSDVGWSSAHRVALSLHLRREIDPEVWVRHSCGNPPCCNPSHLFESTGSSDGSRVRTGVSR